MHLFTLLFGGLILEATYLTTDEKRVQHVSEGSMAVLQIATRSSGSTILFFHSHLSRKMISLIAKLISDDLC
jgi:hypothetical protein